MSRLYEFLAARRAAEEARALLERAERALPPSEQPDEMWRRVYRAAYRENRRRIRAEQKAREAAQRAAWLEAHPERVITPQLVVRRAIELFRNSSTLLQMADQQDQSQ